MRNIFIASILLLTLSACSGSLEKLVDVREAAQSWTKEKSGLLVDEYCAAAPGEARDAIRARLNQIPLDYLDPRIHVEGRIDCGEPT